METKDIIKKLMKEELFFEDLTDKEKDNEDIALFAIQIYPHNFKLCSQRLKNDKSFILKSLEINGDLYCFLNEPFVNDKEIFLQATKNGRFIMEYAGEDIKRDRNLVEVAAKKDYTSLKFASTEIQSDAEFILKVVKHNKQSLIFLTEPLTSNKEFMMKLIEYDPNAYTSCHDEVKRYIMYNDFELLKQIAKYARHFDTRDLPNDIKEKLLEDEKTLLEILKHKPFLFEKKYINQKYINNKNFFLKVLEINGSFLKYASDELKDDDEIVNHALKNDSNAIEYASTRFKQNLKRVLVSLKKSKTKEDILASLDAALLDNEDVILTAILSSSERCGDSIDYNDELIKYASQRLKNSPSFILKLLKKTKYIDSAGCTISNELRDNEDFMLELTKMFGDFAFQFYSERLKQKYTKT